jgi:drug/metabolite transporter (DMT)-like permease
MIWLGLIWSAAMICYMLSVETISVSLAVLILYAYPLLVLLFSIVRRLLPASPMLISLFFFAFIGLYLSLTGSDIKVDTRGILFAALASLGAAYTFICGARIAPTMSPLLMTFWIHAIGLIIIVPLVIGRFSMPSTDTALLFLLAATLFYVVAILCQFEALARLPASSAAFILNLEPVVSILLAGLVLQEQLSPMQWAGVTLVISVIILSIRFKPQTA